MKALTVIFLLSFLFGCSKQKMAGPQEKTKTEVAQAVEQALKNQDLRLYATTGRSLVLPGISGAERKKALALCGYKLMKGTGDVLRHEKQRTQLKERFAFMADYNRRMLAICQQRKDRT